jgi:peptide-methionine (S)-S-oxide reductase
MVMLRSFILTVAAMGALAAPIGSAASDFPKPARDVVAPSGTPPQTAVLAGGCFWGVDAVFKRLKGVTDVVSGFAGGSKATAHYEIVSRGTTGHAESVKVTYDPSQVTYGRLLTVFFAVAHNPTELNRQGPDEGTQYRSAIFVANEDQRQVALAYIQQLDAARVFPRRIVTAVVPLQEFYPAESYHQDFVAHHPTYPYVLFNDLPKLEHLKQAFPELLKP